MIGTGESLSVPVLAQGLLPGPPRGVEEGVTTQSLIGIALTAAH